MNTPNEPHKITYGFLNDLVILKIKKDIPGKNISLQGAIFS